MSIDHRINGYGDEIDEKTSAGWQIVGACLLRFSHFRVNLSQSLIIIGQVYK